MKTTNEIAASAPSWQRNAPAPVQPTAETTSEPAQSNTLSYTEIFGSAHIAAPVEAALASWRRSQAIAQTTPRFAQIGNGLFFPVGNGKKKRRAA